MGKEYHLHICKFFKRNLVISAFFTIFANKNQLI